MIASWKRTLTNDPEAERLMPQIIAKLLQPPEFRLPPASPGHTRHYMPLKTPKTTLVFDAFVSVAKDDPVEITWRDVSLDEAEQSVLDRVLANIAYFGRRESWCAMRVIGNAIPDGINCGPIDPSDDAAAGEWEPVRVLCADPDTALGNEHTPKKEVKSGKGKAATVTKLPIYDPDWHLCMETLHLHEQRWSDPPGSQWIDYRRPSDCFAGDATARVRRPVRRTEPRYIAARYVVDGTVLPLVTETVYMGEIVRQTLQGIYGNRFGNGSSAFFSGKSEDGSPAEGHRHAFFLPTDEDCDGRIDHITVAAGSPFPEREIAVLDAFRTVRKPGGGDPLNLVLVGLVEDNGAPRPTSVPVLAAASVWRSVTPFIPTRHYKKRGQKRDTCLPEDFAEIVLSEELARRGFPDSVRIQTLSLCSMWDHKNRREEPFGRRLRWIEFRRRRVFGNGKRGSHPGAGFVIEFPEPVVGPLAFGYGCHFGLGLFAPME